MNIVYWADQLEPGGWFIRVTQGGLWLTLTVFVAAFFLGFTFFAIKDWGTEYRQEARWESIAAIVTGIILVLILSPINSVNAQPLYQERLAQANLVLIEKYGASLTLSSPPLDRELQPDTIYETGKQPNGNREPLLFNIPGNSTQTCVLSTSNIPKNLTLLCGTPLTEPAKLKTWKE